MVEQQAAAAANARIHVTYPACDGIYTGLTSLGLFQADLFVVLVGFLVCLLCFCVCVCFFSFLWD